MSDVQTRQLGDVVFTCPADWAVEPIPAINGLIALHPRVERNWRANVLLELAPRRSDRPLKQALANLCESLAETQPGLHIRKRSILVREGGGRVARVEYDALQDGVALTQWDVIWDASPDTTLYVTVSSECTLWPHHEPVFGAMLASICSPVEVLGPIARSSVNG